MEGVGFGISRKTRKHSFNFETAVNLQAKEQNKNKVKNGWWFRNVHVYASKESRELMLEKAQVALKKKEDEMGDEEGGDGGWCACR
jgi:hypothetical protein